MQPLDGSILRDHRAFRDIESGSLLSAPTQSMGSNTLFLGMAPRIALLISRVFGVEVDKDGVRRVLAKHDRPDSTGSGPSWLTFIGNARDSLWSVDLFRCESIR